jgi:hypothetical protein
MCPERFPMDYTALYPSIKNYIHNHRCENLSSTPPCNLLHAGFLLGLVFDPEEVGDMFLRITLPSSGLYGIAF